MARPAETPIEDAGRLRHSCEIFGYFGYFGTVLCFPHFHLGFLEQYKRFIGFLGKHVVLLSKIKFFLLKTLVLL